MTRLIEPTHTARLLIAPMHLNDIPQVVAIDRLSFPQPWTEQSYRFELLENRNAHFLVAYLAESLSASTWLARLLGRGPRRRVVGYAGLWVVADEGHINTLAVHPAWRRRGIGERLLQALLDKASVLGALSATLEVRVNNLAAQSLYRKFGFVEVGRRKRFYRDGEDALLMTKPLATDKSLLSPRIE
ncbi:MAG: ribosomal protein S18-alanine N-acetyltransferase [Anaerolineales bacterium]|nr:ribosomal protein S18-alanine N-acetyltransferase [Anaerolineales bacterium]